MHICHVVKDNIGGAPRVADVLASAHLQNGHQVSVVVIKNLDTQWKLFDYTENIFVLNANSNLTAITKLQKVTTQLRPDIFICHGAFPIRTMYLSSLIPRSLSIPVIGYVQSDLVSDICTIRKETKLKDFVRARLGKFVLKITLQSFRKADGLVFVCKELYERHKELGLVHNQVIISYNPYFPDTKNIALDSVAQSWLKNNEIVTFVSAARLDPQKDHETLLKAFAQVCQIHPNARLILLGDGILKTRLQILTQSLKLSDKVLFLGYVPNPRAYFTLSRAVILSSHWEGLPIVLVEAVASGVTFIASDCPVGPRELSEVLECGTIVPPKNINALATAIKSHIETPKIVLDKSQELKQFNVSNCIQNLDKVIISVIR